MSDFWLNSGPHAITVISLLAAVQFAIGMLVGILLSRSIRPSPVEAAQLGQTCRVIEGFCQTATSISTDLAEYQRRLLASERMLRPLDGSAGDLGPTALRKVVSDIVDANEELRLRLEAAETKIRDTIHCLEEQAREARIDSLTRLANRGALDDELKRRFSECQRTGAALGFLLIDVDHFKRFNDTHGHLAGDEVLRRLATCLRGCTRDMDLVARFGGEEFATVLPGTSMIDAVCVARRMLEAVRQLKIKFDGQELSTTISIGVAQLIAGESADALIGRADTALYSAKRDGRNRAFKHLGGECSPIDPKERLDPEQELMDLCDGLRRRKEELASAEV
jgi:diguanylate cyclase